MPGTDTAIGSETVTAVDPKLLEILVCPITKRPLSYDRARGELISEAAGLAFPIRAGVPIMLVEEARRLDEEPVIEPSVGDAAPEDLL
ncbi:MAG: Trm112 family protein [Alphaproteobacteria bacterium]|nr:Trm112 family protein [Alphaproteobacteria bacterium]